MTIRADIQSLSPGKLVELFDLHIGVDTYHFHAGVNELGSDVVWNGITYTRFPVEVTGFEWRGNGTAPRPKIRVANITGVIGALAKANNDLVGAKLVRHRTFSRYLDAVNFAGGVNPTADPNAQLPVEAWYIDRKSSENAVFVEFELASAMDLQGVKLPRRQVIQNVCTWRYRSSECGFVGGAVAKIDDTPTTDINLDQCGKRLASCKLRFGEYAELPFGGFPSAGLLR